MEKANALMLSMYANVSSPAGCNGQGNLLHSCRAGQAVRMLSVLAVGAHLIESTSANVKSVVSSLVLVKCLRTAASNFPDPVFFFRALTDQCAFSVPTCLLCVVLVFRLTRKNRLTPAQPVVKT